MNAGLRSEPWARLASRQPQLLALAVGDRKGTRALVSAVSETLAMVSEMPVAVPEQVRPSCYEVAVGTVGHRTAAGA